MDPLATADDLAARLGRATWTDPVELAQVEAFLLDASAELRSLTGQPLTQMTSTVTLIAGEYGRVTLPAFPVIDVDSVAVEGDVVTDFKVDGRELKNLSACAGDEVEVTYTHGWDPIPDDLIKWTCVLAASQLQAASQRGNLGMSAGVIAEAERIDDYQHQVTFANTDVAVDIGFVLPPSVRARLVSTYGDGEVGWLTYR